MSVGQGAGPTEMLVVEDNLGDIRLIERALKSTPIVRKLHVVRDGIDALAFLRRQGPYTASPRPDLVVLDLNLPRKDGREVLAEIKGDPDLKRIPVVIFTSSAADEDAMRAYNLHANCYVTKPVDLKGFLVAVRSIEYFWLTVAKLPPF